MVGPCRRERLPAVVKGGGVSIGSTFLHHHRLNLACLRRHHLKSGLHGLPLAGPGLLAPPPAAGGDGCHRALRERERVLRGERSLGGRGCVAMLKKESVCRRAWRQRGTRGRGGSIGLQRERERRRAKGRGVQDRNELPRGGKPKVKLIYEAGRYGLSELGQFNGCPSLEIDRLLK